MFNEHVYRCSLNNKRTILSNSAENQQANKLCKILSFCVRRFWAQCCALYNISCSGRHIYKRNNSGTTREFWIRSVVFMFQHSYKVACKCLLKSMLQCVRVWIYSKEEDVRFQFISWTEDERTKYGRMEGRKSLATEERMRYPPVVATISHYKLLCVGDIKTEKGNKTN